MSLHPGAVASVAVAVVAGSVAGQLGAGQPVGWLVGATAAGVTLAAWLYSPLPSTNGGWGAPAARLQEWGWTSEPRDDQPAVQPRERFAWRPGWLGIYWASNQPDPADGDEAEASDR